MLLQEINDVMDDRERSTAFAREARERLQAAMTSLQDVGSGANSTTPGGVTRSSSEEGRQWDGRAAALRHAIRGLEALSASVAGHGGIQQTSEFSRVAARHIQRVQTMRNEGSEGGRLLPYLRREGAVWRSWERRGGVFAPATRSGASGDDDVDEETGDCGKRRDREARLDGAGSGDFPVYPRRDRRRRAEREREAFVEDDDDYDQDIGSGGGLHGLGIGARGGGWGGIGGSNQDATSSGFGGRQGGHRLGTLREFRDRDDPLDGGLGTLREFSDRDAPLDGDGVPQMGGLPPGIGNGAIIVTVAFAPPGAPGGRHRIRLASSYQGAF